ncbi:MAG: FHA domain-containing protein [Myxococcales bacterium]|nr:FHA domain-containing protein [Myxococcales bacterium]
MSTAMTAQIVDSQSNQTWEATYERFPVRIGRNQLNDLHIDRPYISQFHAAIEVSGSQIWVKDLGSTNGTMYRGNKLQRDQPIEITQAPEIQIGPVVIRVRLQEVQKVASQRPAAASVLDIGTEAGLAVMEQRRRAVAPGQEDPFIRQLVPYIEAYRQAWANVYRLVYEHLTRLQPAVRTAYIKRLLIEYPPVSQEGDFQKVAQYYGVPTYEWGELSPSEAALAGMHELAKQLAPELPNLDDPTKVLGFARRLRDSMDVFLKCFVSLRDGYQEFEAEVLRRERFEQQGNRVGTAKDHQELAKVLFAPDSNSDVTCQQLQEVFVEVMTHQVAMLNGVMEGVKQLLDKLSPEAIEQTYESKGKRGGLFSNKYEGLWEAYQTVHGDYRGEDKETFLIIFGPQFSRAYAATTGEAYQSSGEAGGGNVNRLTMSANTSRR